MVDTLRWGIVFATVGEPISEGELEKIAKVAGTRRELLVDELVEDDGAILQGMRTEAALAREGKADCLVLVGGRKGEVGTADAVRLAFQEPIAIVEKSIEGEPTDVGLQHGLVVAGGVAMGVVVAEVPHARQHDAERSDEVLGNDNVIGVVAQIEELDAALVGSREHKLIVVVAVDFLHVGMVVVTKECREGVAETWRLVVERKGVLRLATGTTVGIAQVDFPFVLHHRHVACCSEDGEVWFQREVIVQGPRVGKWIRETQFGTQKRIVALIVSLVIVLMIHSHFCRILYFCQFALQLCKGVHFPTANACLCRGCARIAIVCIFLIPLCANGQGEGTKPMLVEGFRLERIGRAIGMVGIVVVGVVVVGTDVGADGVERERLLRRKATEIIEVESGRSGLVGSVDDGMIKAVGSGNLSMNSCFFQIGERTA